MNANDFDRALRRGGVTEGGAKRINDIYTEIHIPGIRIGYLKSEMGTAAGHSFDFEDGYRGYVDYTPEGVKFTYKSCKVDPINYLIVPWAKVDRRIAQLVQDGTYYTQEDNNND